MIVLVRVIENEQNSLDEGTVVFVAAAEKSDFVGSCCLLGRSSWKWTAENGQLAEKLMTGLCLVEIIRNFDCSSLDLNVNAAAEDLWDQASSLNLSSWPFWIQMHLFLLQRSVLKLLMQMRWMLLLLRLFS